MVAHPEFVAGTDRLDTDLMRAAGQRLFAKVGAEGFYCAGIPAQRIGVALKVEDGAEARRRAGAARRAQRIDAIDAGEFAQLSRFSAPELLNTRNETVGHLRTDLTF